MSQLKASLSSVSLYLSYSEWDVKNQQTFLKKLSCIEYYSTFHVKQDLIKVKTFQNIPPCLLRIESVLSPTWWKFNAMIKSLWWQVIFSFLPLIWFGQYKVCVRRCLTFTGADNYWCNLSHHLQVRLTVSVLWLDPYWSLPLYSDHLCFLLGMFQLWQGVPLDCPQGGPSQLLRMIFGVRVETLVVHW